MNLQINKTYKSCFSSCFSFILVVRFGSCHSAIGFTLQLLLLNFGNFPPYTIIPPYTITVAPVFRGLCDQGTPAVSGQYNDVRGDFQYKLTRDQGTPANADADRHLFVIFAPQPGDSALFILFSITLGRKRYQISLLMRIISLKRMSNRLPQLRTPNNNDASRRCASWEK